MAPISDDTKARNAPPSSGDTLSGEEVVISGISGMFPSSDNVDVFMENLFNNVDMVTAEDVGSSNPEMPGYMGRVSGVDKFDAQFFRVTHNQAVSLDAMTRKLLEQSYCAMYDAGTNPLQYKGKKIGVFVGPSHADTSVDYMYNESAKNHFLISGSCRAMLANRISYYMDGIGPSYTLECASAGSMACLYDAYSCIKRGQCEAAIVGSCSLCTQPVLALNLNRGGGLCMDGKTKCFDKKGDGVVRSETISVIFLQKAKDAKRIYAEICDTQIQYGLRTDSELLPIPIRKVDHMVKFLEEFYSKTGVSPSDVEYVEANAAALAEADANELAAIGHVFGQRSPVLVGSVKSNMGDSEAAAGACAITKLCLAYHKGKLPANLHYSDPLDIPAITEGQVEVLTENTPFGRGYAAVNTFSFNGIDSHVLLKGHYKPKDLNLYKSPIPRLVLISGRHEAAVSKILTELSHRPVDPEMLGLLNNVYEIETPGHTCRGYGVIESADTEPACLSRSVQYYPGGSRPLCLVYSGMGSQWRGMGAALMRIPVFADAVHRCHKILEPKGMDLLRIITDQDKSLLDNVLNIFVGIAAIQIGLTDVLKELGIEADYIIGHSVGELGCAYYDGTLTVEETMLAAYTRGVVSVENKVVHGAMAAVGLGYKDIVHLCPPEIDIACHNSATSSTLSGPAEVIDRFVHELEEKGIFAKKVPSGNIAYHSRYIAKLGPDYKRRMSKIIKTPVTRSERWICTSQPEEKWAEPVAQYSSAEYHANNLLNPVLFEESARKIPSNAVMVEVAPHGLLQAILRRSHPECTHIPLTRRNHQDPVLYLFEAVGKLYQQGYNPQISKLYPPIQFPVSTETPLLSHYVEWEHSVDWPLRKKTEREMKVTTARDVAICLQDDDFSFLAGHVREGNIVIPEAAMLCLVWETFAMHKGGRCKDTSVVFREVKFHDHQLIQATDVVKLGVMINKGNGYFEVTQDKTLLSTGNIETIKSSLPPMSDEKCADDDVIRLNSEDVYRIMNSKGLSYRDEFQSITSFVTKENTAQVKWTNNWITFLDSLIQVLILSRCSEDMTVPKIINKLTINTVDHMNEASLLGDTGFCAKIRKYSNIIRCGGVEIKNVVFEDRPIKDVEPDVVASSCFIPHNTGDIDLKTALQVNLQIVADNIQKDVITVAEVANSAKIQLSDVMRSVVDFIPHANFDVKAKPVDIKEDMACPDLLVVHNLFTSKRMHEVFNVTEDNNFILTLEDNIVATETVLFDIITRFDLNGKMMALLKKVTNKDEDTAYVFVDNDSNFNWISEAKSELQKNRRIVFISDKEAHCGLIGFVKKMRKEHGNKISLLIIDDDQAPDFDPETHIYKEQTKKKLTINVFKKKQWGGYYYLPSPKEAQVSSATVKLINSKPGDLDSLKWVEAQPQASEEELVQVHFAGITAKDVEKAAGVSNTSADGFGMDFSGVDYRGNRVMGIVPAGSLGSLLRPRHHLLWPVPAHYSLEEAATVPLPYLLAYYTLTIRHELVPNETVFVTHGSGALGQAVIAICLALGCTVYTSVGDQRKKRLLMSLFPTLSENNIGYTEGASFYSTVTQSTNNKLCDVVVNCASGSERETAMKCVAVSGVFLDLSDRDMRSDRHIGMSYLKAARSYMAVSLDSLFREENYQERMLLHKIISEGLATGVIRPISHVVYNRDKVSMAFRLIAEKKHCGRVLIKMGGGGTNVAIPRITCSAKDSYIVICDDTELGVELAHRLIKRGTRNLVLHLNSTTITGYLELKLTSWRKLGVKILIRTEDLQSQNHCLKLIKEAKNMGTVRGIFIINESTQKKDRYDEEDFEKCTNRVKAVVNNLNFLSRTYCSKLSEFAVIARDTDDILDEYTTGVVDSVCRARGDSGLPAALLRVQVPQETSLSQKSQTTLRPLSIQTVLNALETSMKLKIKSAVTYNLKKTPTEFLKKIARVIGVEDINDMNENLSIKDVKLNPGGIEELRTILKGLGKINKTIKDLNEMSIGDLKHINTTLTSHYEDPERGLAAFYKLIDSDEILATETVVPMTTPLDVTGLPQPEQDLDADETYLMLIPGFEGHHHIFNSLCERIKVKALTFQLGPDLPVTSIPDMALSIYQFMKQRFRVKSSFYLLGYSFGVNVALEIATLLEGDGLTGVVYCLDSSPDALRMQMEKYIGELSDSELQNAILEQMFAAMTGRHVDIEKNKNWREKIDLFVNKMKNFKPYTKQYQEYLLESAYRRIILAKDYKPNFVLDSQIVLIKGETLKGLDIADDYNLSRYSKKEVKIFNVQSKLDAVLEDCSVPNIVNKMLEPKLLQDFNTKNLCHAYLFSDFDE